MPWLQPQIVDVSPVAIGISPKTWSNHLSDLRSAIALLDREKPRVNRRKDLTEEWQGIFEQLVCADVTSVRYSISGFIFFLNRMGIAPANVSNADALAYRDDLIATQLRKDPEETYRKTIAGWNRAAKAHGFWPQQRLSAPTRQKKIRPATGELSASFTADLDAYLSQLKKPDLFASNQLKRALRPATITARRNQIFLFAGALMNAGVKAEALAGLQNIVNYENVRLGLEWLIDDNNGVPRSSHASLASNLVSIAEDYLCRPSEEVVALRKLAGKLKERFPRRRGMTEKNLARLRPFRDTEVLQRLFALPDVLFAKGLRNASKPQGLIAMRDAIMLAILRNFAIRRQNLLNFTIEENIERQRNGKAFLVFREKEVKNHRLLEFEIPPALLTMIDQYLALRPYSRWLFPSPKGDQPLNPTYVSSRVPKLIHRELGVEMNVHFARHLAAFAFLSFRPGHYEELRRLLGHSATSVTLDVYAGFETDAVGRRYSEHIQEVINQPKAKGRK
jgi:integrase